RYLVQRLFHARVAQRVPLLQEVDAQHRRQRIRLPTALAHLWIVRRDQRLQPVPRHHLLHLRQKHLAPRLLALARVFRVPEAQLHRRHPSNLALLSPKDLFRASLGNWLEGTYLWDYELPSYSGRSGDSNGYYLLSRIKPLDLDTMKIVLQRLPGCGDLSHEELSAIVQEVARRGIP